MFCPRTVVVAGDWHGNTRWATDMVDTLDELLPDEPRRLVLHAGDFGVWPCGENYLRQLTYALEDVGAELWFVDGNHEWFPRLRQRSIAHGGDGGLTGRDQVPVTDRISWLPRGFRWEWHGRSWLALGGAVSVDRADRDEGVSWWADETITQEQAQWVAEGGPAEVMLCHDAPASVPLRLPPPGRSWASRDLARGDRHRERLQDVVDVVRPTHLIHGHYHVGHQQTVPMAHGPVEVTGLDRDGALDGNHRVLDVRDMRWLTGG
jgi:hypothetical protein